MPAAIQLTGLTKEFYHSLALRNTLAGFAQHKKKAASGPFCLGAIDVQISEGSCTGIIGLNASGKTTLLKIIAGMLAPTKGDVYINARAIYCLGYFTGIYDNLTLKEHLYPIAANFQIRKKDFDRLLDEDPSFESIRSCVDKKIYECSSGIMIRALVLTALSSRAGIFLLDEPMIGSDLIFRAQVIKKIAGLSNQGRTVLISSHEISFLDKVCQQALWLEEGKLKAHGEAGSIFKQYASANG